jgi:hypothetical protein
MQMKNIPQKIYLQIGQGNEDEPDFSAFSEVTWSADKVFSNDIEFVLQQTPCTTQLPLVTELREILKTIEGVEENQILANHKEVRRLIFKAMFDLQGVIKRQLS